MRELREYFPFFSNQPLIYLDSAATSQALYTVIEDQHGFNLAHRANAHRSGHRMGAWIDGKYHQAKELIGQWLNIDRSEDRIIFTSGATQSLNDAVTMIGDSFSRATIYIGIDSHHSLFLPFLRLSESSFFNIKLINVDFHGNLDLEQLEKEVVNDDGPKVLAFTPVSNVLGRVNDIARIKAIAKKYSMTTVVDASQYVSKRNGELNDFDFVAWSWHKIYGPTGLGCLVIGNKWIDCEPIRPGGGSVIHVTTNHAMWQTNAGKFESGTLNLGAIAAIPRLVEWLIAHREDIEAHDKSIAKFVNSNVPSSQFTVATESESSLISLTASTGATEDYAYMLDAHNIMVRAGKLCAEPLLTHLKTTGLLRLSWAAYTTHRDIDQAFDALGQIHGRLSRYV